MKRTMVALFCLAAVGCSDTTTKETPDSGDPFDLGGFDAGDAGNKPADLGRDTGGGDDLGPGDMAVRDVSDASAMPDLSDASNADASDVGPDSTTDMTVNTVDVGDAGDTGPDMATLPPCQQMNPPPRCSEDPDTFEWAPAGVINTLELQGTDNAPECCFDLNGDGEIDNALGMNLAAFGFLADVNLTLGASIANGEYVGIFEFDTIADLSDDTFQTNFYSGAWGPAMTGLSATGNEVEVNASDLEMGAQPRWFFNSSSLIGGTLEASDGTILGLFPVFTLANASVPVYQARIEATVDGINSGLPLPGVALMSGQLGGVIATDDIFQTINDIAGQCSCLGLGNDPLYDVQSSSCNMNADVQACEIAGETTCAELADNCSLLPVIPLLADVDLDGDAVNDAVSVGFEFTTWGATIVGVNP
jgi:hypothetical protein